MAHILRNVEKTFTFDEQRIEFNELAVDVYNLRHDFEEIGLNDIAKVDVGPESSWVIGNIIKWDGTNWSRDIDVSGITLSVVYNPLSYNPTVEERGNIEYDGTTGVFTYTPPTLFSGDYDDLSNKPTFTDNNDYVTDASLGTGVDAKKLTLSFTDTTLNKTVDLSTIGSTINNLSDLDDTNISNNVQPNDLLKWDGTDWVSFTPSYLTSYTPDGNDYVNGLSLSGTDLTLEFSTSSLNQTIDLASLSGGAENYTDLDDTPSAYPAANATTKWIKVNTAGDGLEWTDAPVQVQADWTQAVTTALDYIKNKPQIPAAQVQADWDESVPTEIDFIKNKPDIPTEIEDLNVTITNIDDGHVLKWQTDQWVNAVDNVGTGGTGIALDDLEVVSPNPPASGSGGLAYNNLTGKFTYTPPVLENTTYSQSAVASGDNVNLRLTAGGSGSGNDDILITAGSNITFSSITANGFTIDASGGGSGVTNGDKGDITVSNAGTNSENWSIDNNTIGTDELSALGTTDLTTYLRGDNTWQPLSGLSGLQHVKEDLTPELGGKLETGTHTIDFTGSGSGAIFGGPSTTYGSRMFIHHDTSSNTSFIDDASNTGLYLMYYNQVVIKNRTGSTQLTVSDSGVQPSKLLDKDGQMGSVGQILSSTGTQLDWIPAPSGGANVDTSDTPPTSPSDGDLWWNSNNGELHIYYEDTNSSQWVEANGGGGSGSGSTTFTGLTDTPNTHDNDKWLKSSGGNLVWADAPIATSSNNNDTYVTYLNGQPRWSLQTVANNWQESISYQTASNTGPGGVSLAPLCDGNNGTYVNMGIGHANISYLWLSQAWLTDVIKVTIGYDGDGWVGFGGSGTNPSILPVEGGGTYTSGISGSPTELVLWDSSSPAFSGQLQNISFTSYDDPNGTAPGGVIKGATSVCHVYYFKITRSIDNVLTEITYTFTTDNTTDKIEELNSSIEVIDNATDGRVKITLDGKEQFIFDETGNGQGAELTLNGGFINGEGAKLTINGGMPSGTGGISFFNTKTTASTETYNLPTAYPSTSDKVLGCTTTGTMSWVDKAAAATLPEYSIEAMLSTGIQLMKDGTSAATDRVFFDEGHGMSIVRTNTSPWTIEFSAAAPPFESNWHIPL